MLDLLHIRHFPDQLIVAAPKPVHNRIFLAAGLDPDHNFITVFPFLHIPGDQLHRILEVGYHRDHAVARHLQDPVIRRIELAEIPRVKDRFDLRIPRAELPQQRPGIVCRIIVDKHQLVIILGQLPRQNPDHRFADGHHIFLFVIAGDQNTDFLHLTLAFLLLDSESGRLAANSLNHKPTQLIVSYFLRLSIIILRIPS